MRTTRSKGFTLIELMIVVAIIGILAAIAIPNFMKFRSRARQTEVKTNLKALYTASKASMAEYSTYDCGFCQWIPEKGYIYNYHARGITHGGGQDGCTAAQGGLTDIHQTTWTFTVGGAGNIDTDPLCDGWTINDAHNLSNRQDDVNN